MKFPDIENYKMGLVYPFLRSKNKIITTLYLSPKYSKNLTNHKVWQGNHIRDRYKGTILSNILNLKDKYEILGIIHLL